MSQSQNAKVSLRNENDLKPTFQDLDNIFDTDDEPETADSVRLPVMYQQHSCHSFELLTL